MKNQMRKVGIRMSVMMGVTLSFFLSLTGMGVAGQLSQPGWFPKWLSSFLISLIISFVIGFLVPMGKVTMAIEKNPAFPKGALKTKLLETLLSDLIYTPLITLCMVAMAWYSANSHGGHMPFLPAFLKSLGATFLVGYVLIFIFMPVFTKLAFKGIGPNTHE